MRQFVFQLSGVTKLDSVQAGALAGTVRQFYADTFLYHGEQVIDAKKIFRLLELRLQEDKPIYVLIRGEDAAEAEDALHIVLENTFGGSVWLPVQRGARYS